MLTIIHGDEIVSSRKEFIELRQKADNPITLEGEKLTIEDLMQAMSGGGLFEESQKLFIEQLLTRKKSTEQERLIAFLQTNNKQAEIYLWENKEIDKKILTAFNGAIIKLHKIPQLMFQFLDSLKPQNTKSMLILYQQTRATTEPELIFFMLIRHFRLLLALTESTPNAEIDETKRMADWQKGKLVKQARLFKKEQLLTIYQALFHLEVAQKTGNLTLPLHSSIDILLMGI